MKGVSSIFVRVRRGDNDKSWIQEYEVPCVRDKSVLQVLKKINEDIDPSLTFYSSCRLGKCGLCRMLINGKLSLACTTPASGDFMVEPDPSGKLIRDLLVVWNEKNKIGG